MAFEAILSRPRANERAPQKRRQLTLTFSVLVHALAIAFGVAHSVWQVGEMPLPTYPVTLAMAPAPSPPPPPPPRRAGPKRKPKPVDATPKVIVAPIEAAKDEPESSTDNADDAADEAMGEDETEAGGVIGGVPGGIAGGLAQPPPPPSRGPKLLSMQAGNQLLAINPNVRPYRVNVPDEFTDRMGAGEKISPVIRICVTARGTVQSVALVKSSIALIDQQIPTVIGRWRYEPYLLDGRPQPFCYVTKYTVAAR